MNYDVFISCKSEDYRIAEEVYQYLKDNGFHVFLSSKELKKIKDSEYNNAISEALESAYHLIVLSSSADNFQSKWVHFEWETFLNELLDNRKEGQIMTLTKDLSVADLPIQLRRYEMFNFNDYKEKILSYIETPSYLQRKSEAQTERNELIITQEKTSLIHQAKNVSSFDNDLDYEEGLVLYDEKEYNDAIKALLVSAERGNPKAKTKLCEIFYKFDKDTSVITDDIWEMVENQAKANHCYANFIMHTKFYDITSGHHKSFEYLKKSISKSNIPLAYLRLGIHHGWGMGKKQDHTLAMHYYKKALDMGCMQAYSYIGQEYEYGNDKLKIDVKKAHGFYEEGAKKGDKRSLGKLIDLYTYSTEFKNYEKAKEWAQKEIELDIADGYVALGDVYWQMSFDGNSDEEEMQRKAAEYYKKGAKRDVKQAYSSLCWLYWNKNENDNAYKWAFQGYKAKDSLSIWWLGYIKENEEKYEEAWKYYKERYLLFGVGAEALGKLFVEYDCKPKDTDLHELCDMLEVCARNSNLDSLKYLIEIYSDEKYGIVDKEKILNLYKLGAELGFEESMFKYGLSFMGENEHTFNPVKGLEWINNSAAKGCGDAIKYLIKESENLDDVFFDKTKKHKLICYALEHGVIDEDCMPILMRYGKEFTNKEDVEKFKTFLINQYGLMGKKPILKFKIMNELMSNHYMHVWELEQDLVKRIEGQIQKISLAQCGYYSYLSELRPYLGIAEPSADGKNFDGCYGWNVACQYEVNISQQDKLLQRLYLPMKEDCSFENIIRMDDISIFGIDKFWGRELIDFRDCYQQLCERYNVNPEPLPEVHKQNILPYFPSSLAQKIKMEAVKCMLSILPFFKLQNNLLLNSYEKILDIAEKMDDVTVQSFLNSYVETCIYTNEILENNYNLYENYLKKDKIAILRRLNEYRNSLIKNQIPNNLSEFTEENVSFDIENVSSDVMDDKYDGSLEDEFVKLLKDFIENQ